MRPISYVHAANLRLDTPLAGLSGTVPDAINKHLATAGFTALSRLVALCQRERPDFLLLLGSTLDARTPRLESRLRLAEAFATLYRQNLPVFVLPGDSDPASLWQRFPDLPPNVRILHDNAEPIAILREGTRVALLHTVGMAHAEDESIPHIGAALCQAALCSSESIAPLIWALGHDTAFSVHEGQPMLSVCGAHQGLSFDEPGLHGCAVTTIRKSGEGFAASVRFEPLSPVEWRTITVPMGQEPDEAPFGNVTDAADTLTEKVSGRIARALGAQHVDLTGGCELVILRILLEGATPLDARLREPGLRQRLQERLTDVSPLLWTAELVPLTRQSHTGTQADNPESRPDLAGELARLSTELDGHTLNAMALEALSPLLQGTATRPNLRMPENEPLRELVRSAVSLCLDQLDATDGRTAREKI